MGAGGCLGPRKLKNEVYMQLITQMHNDAHKVTYSQARNLDIYTVIKQKMIRKGQLRKIVDNLSSHRNKISESLNYNYKLTTQTKQMQRRYVGLIISDAIIDIMYPSNSNIYVPHKEMFYEDQQIMSSLQSSEQHSKNDEMKRSKNYLLPSPKKHYQFYQQSKTWFDEQYFKLITFLFQNQKRIHYRLLESIATFCQKHKGVISCQSYIWKIAARMTENIGKNIYLQQSCKVFNLLLLRTKEQLVEQLKDSQTLITIIKVWLRQKQYIGQDRAQVLMNCHQIIQIYFNRCISAWDSLFLYEICFKIYDKIQFQKNKLHLIENLSQETLRNHDLRGHYFRGLFNYLLGYLSITHESVTGQADKKCFATSLGLNYEKMKGQYKNILKDSTKIQGFKLLNHWVNKKYTDIDQFCMYNTKALIFVYLSNAKYYYRNKTTFQILMDEYFKMLNKLTKQNKQLFKERLFQQFREQGLQQIQYELLLKLVKQILYKQQHMYFSSENSSHSSRAHYRSLNYDKSIAFKKTNSKTPLNSPKTPTAIANLSLKHNLTQLEQQKQNEEDNQSFLIIPTSTLLSEHLPIYFTPILGFYSEELKLQILKIVGYILSKVQQIKVNEEGKLKLCQFLYSIYENIILSKCNIYQKYEFVCAVLSVFRLMLIKSAAVVSTPKSAMKIKVKKSLILQSQQTNKKSLIQCKFLFKAFIMKIQKQLAQSYNKYKSKNKINQINLSVQSQYILLYLINQCKSMLANDMINNIDNISTSTESKRPGIFITNKSYNSSPNKQKYSSKKQSYAPNQIDIRRDKMNKLNNKITVFYHNRQDNRSKINDMAYYFDEGIDNYQSQLLLQVQQFVREIQEQNQFKNQPQSSQIQMEITIEERNQSSFSKKMAYDQINQKQPVKPDNQKQVKNPEQLNEYLSIFLRVFSPYPANGYNNGFQCLYNRPRGASRDSDATSMSMQSGYNGNFSLQKKRSKNSIKSSNQSFQDVMDIVRLESNQI